MTPYYRPIAQTDMHRPRNAFALAGGWAWFTHVEVLERGRPGTLLPASEVPASVLECLTAARPAVAGVAMHSPAIMGILNVTPDSFSDGGRFVDPEKATQHALQMAQAGANILDIGGESTRPGAKEVSQADEIARTAPVIAAIRTATALPISIDTRKALVARRAVESGADLINDVSAYSYDPAMKGTAAELGLPVCVMHAQGDPETMQKDPRYDDVLLDVYDFLQSKVDQSVAAGLARDKIIVDPGIGFGKTLEHNLRLLRGISLFHGLGCPILLGVSRKRFIGTLSGTEIADERTAGSVAVAMAAVSQGVQILRVHDVAETRQALSLHMSLIRDPV